jgi:membrane-associated phospholipid phosphatase
MQFIEALDLGSLFFMPNLHHPWLNAIMTTGTHAGDTWVLAVVVLLAFLGFAVWQRRFSTGLLIFVALLSSWSSFHVAKWWVGRARPDVAWAFPGKPTDPGFPSGHATASSAVYGLIALSLIPLLKRRVLQSAVAVGTVILVVAIGFSRMFLGWHYLSDIVGGWALGMSLALLLRWVDLRWGNASTAIQNRVE